MQNALQFSTRWRIVFFLILLCNGSMVFAQTTYTWKTDSIGSWHDSSLWNPTGVPGSDDVAQIGPGVVSLDSISVSVRVVNLTGGVIRAGGAKLTVLESMTWTSGNLIADTLTAAILDTVEFVSGSNINIAGGGSRTVDNFYVINHGTLLWNSTNSLFLKRNAVFENPGTFEMLTDRRIANSSPDGGTFINRGTLIKNGSTGKSFIETPFINTGNIAVNVGSIQCDNSGSLSGATISVAQGSEFILRNGAFALDSITVTGSGTLSINGAQLSLGSDGLVIDSDATFYMFSSGTKLIGDGNIVNNGTFHWNRGEISGGGILINNNLMWVDGNRSKDLGKNWLNNAQIEWRDTGNINFKNDVTWRNAPAATINITGDATIIKSSGTANRWVNESVITKTTGIGTTAVQITLKNQGILNINNGTFRLMESTSDSTGIFNIESGAELELDAGTHNLVDAASITGPGTLAITGGETVLSGTFDATGEVRLEGGKLTFAAPDTLQSLMMSGGILASDDNVYVQNNFDWSDGDLEGSGTLIILNTMQMTGTSSATKYIRNHTLKLLGSSIWSGSADIRLNDAGQIIVEPGATFEIQTGADIIRESGATVAGTFLNRGAVIKSLVESTTTVESVWQNEGEMAIRSGTMRFNRQLANTASGIISGTDTLNVQSAAFTNAGTFRPGNSVGILRVVNDLPMTASSVVDIEIQGNSPGVSYDQLHVRSNAQLAGTLNFSVANGYSPAVTDTFFVVKYGARSGVFTAVNGPAGATFTSGYGDSAFYITNVNVLNSAPVANDDQYNILEDRITLFNVLANDTDTDNDPLTVSTLIPPLHGSVTVIADTAFQYTPAGNFFGSDSFRYVVSDPDGAFDNASVRITVQPVNDAPVVAGIPDVIFAETQTFTLDLDTFVSDVDDNIANLAWSARVLTAQLQPAVAAGEAVQKGGEATVVSVDTSDLQITIDPVTHVASFTASTLALSVFTASFTATDPGGASDSDTITVTVTGTVSPPVVVNPIPNATFAEDGGPLVAVNDLNTVFLNPEPNTLTFSVLSLNSNIQATRQGSQVRVNASPNYFGSGNVIVTANNTLTTSDTFLVTVTPVNDAPVAGNIPDVTFPEDGSTTLNLTPYGSDIDNTLGQLLWSAQVIAASGTFTMPDGVQRPLGPNDLFINIDANKIATFAATADSNGVFEVAFTVSDPGGLSDSDTITVTVSSILDPPVLVNPIADVSFNEDSGSLLVANLRNVFSNPEPTTNMIFGLFSSSTGVQVSQQNGDLYLNTTPHFNGNATVIVTANNGSGTTVNDTFAVTVVPVNDPPVLSLPNVTFQEDTTFTLNLDNFVLDVDHSDAVLLWTVQVLTSTTGNPADLTIAINPVTHVAEFSVVPDGFGDYTAKFTVQDPAGLLDADTILVSVTEFFVNTPPIVVNPIPDVQFLEDLSPEMLPASLNEVFFDPDLGQLLSYSVSSNSSDVSVVLQGDSVQISYPPDFHGSATVIISATDDSLAIAADTVLVTILNINDPPVISVPASFTTLENTPFVIDLDTLVSDIDDPLALLNWSVNFVNGTPQGLQLNFNNATHVLTITPQLNVVVSNESLRLEVCDPASACVSVIVPFSIIPVNDPPVISGLPQLVTFSADSSVTIDLWNAVSDPETLDSLLAFDFSVSNDSLLFDFNTQSGILTLSALDNFGGSAELVVTVTDLLNLSVSDTILAIVQSVVGIEDFNGLPTTFAIDQNYPNPFNPLTSINYQLPETSDVKLQVYNILGQLVATLVSHKQPAGRYTVRWDGSNQSGETVTSGIYFYRLEVREAGFVQTRKMILMK